MNPFIIETSYTLAGPWEPAGSKVGYRLAQNAGKEARGFFTKMRFELFVRVRRRTSQRPVCLFSPYR